MYCIRCLCHRTDISMGAHGFVIDLEPRLKDAVAASKICQKEVDRLISRSGRTWLDATGFNAVYDPDNSGAYKDESLPPGPNARPLYEPRSSLRVRWGDWGPEHICVPGNACGLDIDDRDFGCIFEGGRVLLPHNVDSLAQKYLLLIVFTEIIESVTWRSRPVSTDKWKSK